MKIYLLLIFTSFLLSQDNNPPELTYFSFSPDTISINRNPVEFIFQGTDDISGFSLVQIMLLNQNTNTNRFIWKNYDGETEIIDSLYHTFEYDDPEGIWNINNIQIRDQVDNGILYSKSDLEEMGFQTEIFVINDDSDNNPPELTYFSFSPNTINLNRNPVEFIFQGTDDISGFSSVQIMLLNQNTNTNRFISKNYDGETEIIDSLYHTFEFNDPEGIWNINNIQIWDQVDNGILYSKSDLEEMGFETNFVILNQSFSVSTVPEIIYLNQNNQSQQIEFNIEITNSNFSPTLYEWDFNSDGNYDWSSTLNEPSYYSYTAAGEYISTVRVTDSNNNYFYIQEVTVTVVDFDVDLAPVDEQVSINWGFGSIQTVLVDDAAIEFMNIGDQIHVVDNSGVVRGGCSHLDMLGTITVGSFTYEGQDDLVHPINCYKTYDNCDETGWYSWDYMNYGEVPEFVVYDDSEDKYFEGLFTQTTPTYRGMSHHILDSLYTGNEVFPNTDFDFLQSTSQSFYYIINASVNGNPIENDDVIGAFRDGICVGYRNWIGNYTDIPVMGNDGGRSYQGYVQDNPMQFLYYNAETEEYTELTPTFEYGQAIFGDETIKINSFDLIRNTETVNYSITESRDDKTYNIYKNQELLVSGISDNEYIDDSIDNDGNYCYEIAIVEDGNEIDMSEPQCIDVTLENQYPAGDINGDYNVNVTDVVVLINYILNNESYPAGDISQDGNVNVTDVVLLINMILNS